MRSKQLQLFVSTLIILTFSSCTRTTEEFTSEPLSDYLPLQTGKYIVYQLDSTLFTNFGTTTEIHSYQEKHLIDAQITDALGRQGYRIFRFLRDVTGTTPWAPAGSYFIIPNDKTIEVVENNLRFIRLALPLKKDFSWKGNHFLPIDAYSQYGFSNDNQMDDWNYTIDSINTTAVVGGTSFTNVLKIVAINSIENVPDTIPVTNSKAFIASSVKSAYLKDNAGDTIKITAEKPASARTLTIYNRSNRPALLDTIVIPVGGGKVFDYLNNKWTFGYINRWRIRKDTVYYNLPSQASKDVFFEKYGKNIGLIYQQLSMWEYQSNPAEPADLGRKVGFEVKREMIDHN